MKFLKLFFVILILAFLGLYFAYSNGYYEQQQSRKISLTNSQIEEFENDIKNGVDVSLEDYLNTDNNYQTKTSELSLKISNKAENIVSSGIKFIFRKLGNMIE